MFYAPSSGVLGDPAGLRRINFNPDRPAVPREIMVKFKPGTFGGVITQEKGVVQTSEASVNAVFSQLRVTSMARVFRTTQPPLADIYRLRFDAPVSLSDALIQLAGDPNVEWVEPNYVSFVDYTPNDTDFPLQWGLTKIEADLAWDISQGDPDIIIAVIDTGVDYDHLDLEDNIWHNPLEIPGNDTDDDGNGFVDDDIGWDFVSVTESSFPAPHPDEDIAPRDRDPMDLQGHGTSCAGVASAVTNNNIGVAGTAWSCRIMCLRAGYMTEENNGVLIDSDSSAALLYAADNGAHVISMSWGGDGSYTLSSAVEYAVDAGCVLVAAAGNSGGDPPPVPLHYPAAYTNVISVAASDQNDGRAWFSSYGPWVDIAAPGVSIYTTKYDPAEQNDTYRFSNGTSMSTPIVSGVAALVLSQNPTMTADDVTQKLLNSADDIEWIVEEEVVEPGKRLNAFRSVSPSVINITVNSPIGGDIIKGGETYNIAWATDDDDGYIDHIHLLYSGQSGDDYQDIVAGTDDNGSYEWNPVPDLNSSEVRLKAIAEDGDNNSLAEYITDAFTVDSSPPQTTEDLVGSPGADEWFRSDVTVTLSATDTVSGVKETKYRISDDPWETYSEPFVITSSAAIRYYSEDNAGNIEEEKLSAINIDKAAPETVASLTGIAGEGVWYISDVTVSLAATDDVSGVKEIRYRVDSDPWKAYSVPLSIANSATVRYYSKDNAGNAEGEKLSVINIDKSAPITAMIPDAVEGENGWYRSDVTVTLSPTDDASGVKETKYKVNDDAWKTYSEPFNITNSSTLRYYSQDNAGNTEEDKISVMNIDKSAPVTTAILDGIEGENGWYKSDVNVILSATDDLAGVEDTKYKLGDDPWKSYLGSFSVTESDLCRYYSEDSAGNMEEEKSIEIKLDKFPPVTIIHLDGSEGEDEWYISDVTVTLSPTDDASGVIETKYKVDDGDWKPYQEDGFKITGSTVYYQSKDDAGNVESVREKEIKIDKTAPLTPVVTDSGRFTNSTTNLYASWTESSDPETGIMGYYYAIGSDPDPTSFGTWISVGYDTEVTATGLSLTRGQNYYFGVRAKNGAGAFSDIGVSDGIVINAPPEVSDIPDLNFPEDGSISVDLDDYVHDITDPDSEINWSYKGAGIINVKIDNSTHAATFNAPLNWNGSEIITFIATDPGSLSDDDAVNVTVYPVNDPPFVTNLRLEPVPPKPGDSLSASYTYYDVDEGTDSSLIKWYRNNMHQPQYDNMLSIPPGAALPGEGWYFTVTPNDGMDSGDTRASSSVTIGGIIQEVHLYSGWNLISISVNVANTEISSVLAPIEGLYESVWGYDAYTENWSRYFGPGIPGSLNNLDTIEPGKGYWVKLFDVGEVILTIMGERVISGTIQVIPGWNLIGYNSIAEELRENVIFSIDYSSIWTYDSIEATWLKYVMGASESFNDLTALAPGKGYWIYVEE